ncbi:unnamed protein product [Polarella glacialis]|uniref:Uncharacterized protein n=1 Tax=Polarella glacialis TaxID=89957 RepID=A0A813H9N4_POLGL|nr:unnamed protein product [Polarella glacialis]
MENVKGYDVGVLRKLFEHLYIIETILLQRRYTLLIHRADVAADAYRLPMNCFMDFASRVACYDVEQYLVATPQQFLYDPTLVTNIEAPQVSGVAEAEVGVAGDGAAGTTDAADAGPAAVAAAASSDSAKTPKTDAADAEIADDDTHVTHVFKLPMVGPISFLRGNGCSYKMTTFHGIDVFVSADKAAFGSDCPVVGWQLPISEEPTLEIEWMTDKWDLPTCLHMNGVASVDVTIPCLVLPDKFRTVSDVVELTRPALPDETNKKQQQRSKLEAKYMGPGSFISNFKTALAADAEDPDTAAAGGPKKPTGAAHLLK